jgi:hypothetical protein
MRYLPLLWFYDLKLASNPKKNEAYYSVIGIFYDLLCFFLFIEQNHDDVISFISL